MAAAPTADLCVVIPHRDQGELLRRAIAACAGWPVLVVDDSESGVSVEGAERLRGGGGEGFARASNRGLAWAQDRGFCWVLLLNDDAAPRPGAIEALLAARHSGLGAAGPILEGPLGVESTGMDWSTTWGRLRQRRDLPQRPTRRDALSGACLLMRSSERLDPAFQHGMEDLALCLDLRRRGLELLLVPQARCWHEGGATLHRRSPEATRHALAGLLRLVGDSPPKQALVLGYALAQVLREGGPPSRVQGLLAGWRDHTGRGRG